MKPELYLSFLQDKIQGIGSALFFNLSSSVLKFPTSIVTTLKVDDAANIWFFANRPEQHLQEFDREFPVRMQFYRKGKGYYLQIAGKAFIVNDPEEINGLVSLPEEVKVRAFKEMVLIRVKISNAEYYEYQPRFVYKNNIKGLLTRVYYRLFKEQPRTEPYIFQPTPRLGF